MDAANEKVVRTSLEPSPGPTSNGTSFLGYHETLRNQAAFHLLPHHIVAAARPERTARIRHQRPQRNAHSYGQTQALRLYFAPRRTRNVALFADHRSARAGLQAAEDVA